MARSVLIMTTPTCWSWPLTISSLLCINVQVSIMTTVTISCLFCVNGQCPGADHDRWKPPLFSVSKDSGGDHYLWWYLFPKLVDNAKVLIITLKTSSLLCISWKCPGVDHDRSQSSLFSVRCPVVDQDLWQPPLVSVSKGKCPGVDHDYSEPSLVSVSMGNGVYHAHSQSPLFSVSLMLTCWSWRLTISSLLCIKVQVLIMTTHTLVIIILLY